MKVKCYTFLLSGGIMCDPSLRVYQLVFGGATLRPKVHPESRLLHFLRVRIFYFEKLIVLVCYLESIDPCSCYDVILMYIDIQMMND